jgi:hypothetical protein
MMGGFDPFVPVVLDRVLYYVDFKNISDLLDGRYSPLVLKVQEKPLQRIHELICEVPFKEIPLHINSSPAIAKWRLEINK